MKGKIIIVIIVIICIAIGGTISIISLNSKSNDYQIPSDIIIVTDREDFRVLVTFNVSLSKEIPDANITWDFSVGFPSYGPTSEFFFLTSHDYVITATIRIDKEKKVINKTIPVKHQDKTVSKEMPPRNNFNPLDPSIVSWDVRPMKGITNPTLTTDIEIIKVSGSFTIVFFEYIVDENEANYIFSEDYTWINKDVNLNYQYLFDDLPSLISDYYYTYQIIMKEGKWDSLKYSSSLEY